MKIKWKKSQTSEKNVTKSEKKSYKFVEKMLQTSVEKSLTSLEKWQTIEKGSKLMTKSHKLV